jgi:hypothetical protein
MKRKSEMQAKVIRMHDFRLGTSDAPLRQVEAYWAALCPAGDVPRRSEIDPRGLELALQNAFVLERIAPGLARFRVAGRLLNDLAGMEVRGMPLTAMFAGPARDDLAVILETVFAAPATAELTLRSERKLAQPAIEARMLLLPLKCDRGHVSRCLGAVVATGRIGSTARRFVLEETRTRALREVPDSAPRPVAGFAEAQAKFSGPRPHLRLVETGRD